MPLSFYLRSNWLLFRPAAALNTDTGNLTLKKKNKNRIKVKRPMMSIFTTPGHIYGSGFRGSEVLGSGVQGSEVPVFVTIVA